VDEKSMYGKDFLMDEFIMYHAKVPKADVGIKPMLREPFCNGVAPRRRVFSTAATYDFILFYFCIDKITTPSLIMSELWP